MALVRLIESETEKESTYQWLTRFEGSGMPYAAVNDVQDTLRHSQIIARETVQSIRHTTCGDIRVVGPPVKFSASPPTIRLPPPILGEHTREILTQCGVDEERMAKMEADGAISMW